MPDMESDTPHVHFELTGRANGKTARIAEYQRGVQLRDAIVDEVSEQTEAIITGPKRLRMTRSGRGAAGKAATATVDGKRTAIPACPHLETRTVQVPHPKYGDKVPCFETYHVRPGPHECLSVLQ